MDTGSWRTPRTAEQNLPVPSNHGSHFEAPVPALERSMSALLDAFELLAHHGSGSHPWAEPFRHDPIAFLLDTISDAANVWSRRGDLLYQNHAAAKLGLGRCDETVLEEFSADGRRFERRCLCCRSDGSEYILEIIHEIA
jgi:hypothetical protein